MFVSAPGVNGLYIFVANVDKTAPCDHFPSHCRSRGVRNEVGAMIPSAKEVEHARELLSQYFRSTRLASAESLAQRSGARVYLKIESDLPTGSFKPRGALNALLTTAPQRTSRGIVPASPANP